MSKRFVYLLCMALACAVFVAACGDDDDSGGGGTERSPAATEGAKAIDPASMDSASGDVTVCRARTPRGDITTAVKNFNAQDNGVTVNLLEFSTSADEQRTQFVQRQEAKSGECDVFSSDVIWTAEFASQKWLLRHDAVRRDAQGRAHRGDARDRHLRRQDTGACRSRPTRRSCTTAPTRSTRFPPPGRRSTRSPAENDGIVYQGAPYEGLTCDFLEIAFAAGGEVLSEDGKTAVIDSPENVAALQFMVDGVKDGTAANGVTTYMEEESRRYFESGKATFMRNWPYAYALGNAEGSQVKGKFDVGPVPGVRGRRHGRHPRRPQPGRSPCTRRTRAAR